MAGRENRLQGVGDRKPWLQVGRASRRVPLLFGTTGGNLTFCVLERRCAMPDCPACADSSVPHVRFVVDAMTAAGASSKPGMYTRSRPSSAEGQRIAIAFTSCVGRAIFCLRQAACLSRSLCRANRKPCMLSVLGRYAASSSYQLQIAVSSSLEHEKGDELLQDTPAPARTTVVHAISFLCSNSEGQVTTTSGWRVRSFLLCRHSRARLFVHGPRIASRMQRALRKF